ncbi:dTDP-4-dehydrorhamnose reductase [Streptomyces sp. 2333.5]|uniref:SDR family oxidoreductase n=1 Tax=unclassified Streptomyces TaxID=2593676 RepID=UPI000897959C|nr:MULTISPECIES: sugar nucleotide-binding protein [unclassified Streptomyces]PJJ00091.1 dTDP-4-dehydrorhamnose reductase [Streptomyces sp. 2333.5]SEB74221.1 dTDP-4-dehydrorhamnose reductase [Streptomyces sp. 2314.4]SEC60832.1 dTDP-4-dehydrorhamnose reductase [Streptomyces sp. 2112.2]
MNILIVGGSGFLGRELAQQALATGHAVTATFATRAGNIPGIHWLPMDLRRNEEITPALRETQPDVVINAAYRKADWATTADGAICLAMAAAQHGSRLVHVSSDAIFSGADVHYDESATPDPVTPYGAAKAAAETAIRLFVPDAVIARTSLIIGDGGSVHEAFVHDLATGRRNGVLFTDDIRCPVHVTDLARAVLELAAGDHAGVCHLAGADAVSRHELGVLIADRDALDASLLTAGCRADTGSPGALDVRLDSSRTQRTLRTTLRGARDFVRRER